MGWSPGLVVMGGGSHPRGHGYKSEHWILDGHFTHANIVVPKNYNVRLKKQKINIKEAGVGPFKKYNR